VLELKGLGVLTPDRSTRLVAGLDLVVSVTSACMCVTSVYS
jgi:hypothetical protein